MPDSMSGVTSGAEKMSLLDVLTLLQGDLVEIEKRLEALERPDVPLTSEIMKHVLAMKGKRVRPLLLLLISRLGAPDRDAVLWASTVIELVHTATLLHDDCLDGTTLRRGVPTVNDRWSQQAAILMGDYLFTKGFDLLRERGLGEALDVLTRETHRMTCGMNREYAGRHDASLSEESYYRVIDEKTGALFVSSCEIGARLAGLPEDSVGRLVDFGRDLGRSFQIIDDVFDFTGDPAEMGKPVGTDFRLGFATLPLIHAFAAESGESAEAAAVGELFERGDVDEEQWEGARRFVLGSGGVESAREKALAHAISARDRLAFLNGHAGVAPLLATVEFMISRGS